MRNGGREKRDALGRRVGARGGNIRERRRRTTGGGCGVCEKRGARESGERRRCDDDGASETAGGGEMRERASSSEKGSSIRIPRHAPSYHIDLAIVTILSSPAMLGCTIAAGGRGMPKSEESSAGGRVRGRRGWRLRGVGGAGRTAWCTTPPRCADVGRRGVERASESAKQSALLG